MAGQPLALIPCNAIHQHTMRWRLSLVPMRVRHRGAMTAPLDVLTRVSSFDRPIAHHLRRGLDMDHDDDGLSAALLAAWDDEPEPEAATLVALPAEVLANVLKRLSAADLVALASTCRALRAAAAEPSHWRRLCASRWPQDDAGRGQLSWRKLYFDKDAAECATAAGDTSADDLMHTIFIQHVVARRSQPPSWTSTLDDADVGLDVPGGSGAAEAVSSFRRVHGLGHGLGHDKCGVAHGCVFAILGSRGAVVAVCTCSGKVHVCDDSTCSVEHTSADVAEATVVCSVTGRIRSHAFLTAHDEEYAHDEDGHPGPEGGEGGSFMPGVWGRAYSAGYEAASEAELHATLWGGIGAGPRGAGKRKRAEDDGGGARRRRSSESAAAGQKHPRLTLLLNKHSQGLMHKADE